MRWAGALILLTACTQTPDKSVGILIDTSGTYLDQSPEIMKQLRVTVLPKLGGGDQLMVMKIDSSSYGWENVLATVQIPRRRRESTRAKREFAAKLKSLELTSARYTDISGALLYSSEYMKGLKTPLLKIIIFSDMKEELVRGSSRKFGETEFEGFDIAVVNSKRLAEDQKDPEAYRKRMSDWEKKLGAAGAKSFELFIDSDRIEGFLDQ